MSADFCCLDTWDSVRKLTTSVLKCSRTKYVFARVCRGKSTRAEEYSADLIRYVVSCIDMM